MYDRSENIVRKRKKSLVISIYSFSHDLFKGGYVDFSHLTKLEYIYVTENYMKKQYKSSRIKNHKITHTKILMVFP